MNNTEFELISKEKLLAMYEQVCMELEMLEHRICEQDSEITELESDIDYWRGRYEDIANE